MQNRSSVTFGQSFPAGDVSVLQKPVDPRSPRQLGRLPPSRWAISKYSMAYLPDVNAWWELKVPAHPDRMLHVTDVTTLPTRPQFLTQPVPPPPCSLL